MKKGVLVFLCIIVSIFILLVTFAILQPLLWELFLGEEAPDITITFSSLLTIMITLLALGVGTVGYFIYQLIEKKIEKRVNELTNEVYQRSIAQILYGVGFTCWCNYKASKEFHHLKNAILFTHKAYQRHAINLNEKNIINENEEVVLVIKNNLAYYVAEIYRLDKDDDVKDILKNTREANRELAINYANEIDKKKCKYLDHFNEWTDTYKFINQHCIEESDKK